MWKEHNQNFLYNVQTLSPSLRRFSAFKTLSMLSCTQHYSLEYGNKSLHIGLCYIMYVLPCIYLSICLYIMSYLPFTYRALTQLRSEQLSEEREKCRVLQESLRVLAVQHYELEQQIETSGAYTVSSVEDIDAMSSSVHSSDDEFYECDVNEEGMWVD